MQWNYRASCLQHSIVFDYGLGGKLSGAVIEIIVDSLDAILKVNNTLDFVGEYLLACACMVVAVIHVPLLRFAYVVCA